MAFGALSLAFLRLSCLGLLFLARLDAGSTLVEGEHPGLAPYVTGTEATAAGGRILQVGSGEDLIAEPVSAPKVGRG